MNWSAAPIMVYRNVFTVCSVLVPSVVVCSFTSYSIKWVLFHHYGWDYHWNFMSIRFILLGFYVHSIHSIRLSETRWFWLCNYAPPWMLLPLDILVEYCIELVTFGLFCVMLRFATRIFYRRVSGIATNCHCGVRCRGPATCLLYAGPFLEISFETIVNL